MKQFLLFIPLAVIITSAIAQQTAGNMAGQYYPKTMIKSKPFIDTTAINNWVRLGSGKALSNDGNYFMYGIENQPTGSQTLIIQATTGSWKKEFPDASTGFFSGDSKKFIFLLRDTLYILSLGQTDFTAIPKVSSYRRPSSGKTEWFAYQLSNASKELILYSLFTGQEHHFNYVTDYLFDNKGNTLLIKKTTSEGSLITNSLDWVSLASGTVSTIWSTGDQVSGLTMDDEGTQVAFMVKATNNEQNAATDKNTLLYYRAGMSKAIEKVNDKTSGIATGLCLAASSLEFSKDGRYIYFLLQQQPEIRKPNPDAVSLDVWSYKDTLIQSTQLLHSKDRITYTALIGTESNEVIQLTDDYETIAAKPVKGDFVVVRYDRMRSDIGNMYSDMYWVHAKKRYFLVSLLDGSRKDLTKNEGSIFWFSPGGRYVLYYDLKAVQYYSYNLQTSKSVELFTSFPKGWLASQSKYHPRGPGAYVLISPARGGITGCWLDNDRAVWLYDNYDIWQFDLAGATPPVNITHGYGRSNRIELRPMTNMTHDYYTIHSNDSLLLVAYNTVNKYNGFYRLVTGEVKAPELLEMGPWTWYHLGLSFGLDDGMKPLKAASANVWIVKRQSMTESPNYFVTQDFKTYRPLTDLHPEKSYNWLTAELINWKQLDGTFSQGILYKPENFDPHKKYPVLIHYYDQMSHRLYQFPCPEFAEAEPNIPWFVSQGYLVFTPDIYYTTGIIGKSAENTIVSAAGNLGTLPYVDTKRMGIAGHSFGGHETYYLLTHTNLFAAVLASAGCANVTSECLSLSNNEASNADFMKSMEGRMGGVTLWNNRERYIDESAVFQADRVTTPLLMIQNKNDDHWQSGIAFFLALRRLGKKVWTLQYDQGTHQLSEKKDQIDFTLRITQFFDYYLKGNLPPAWMTNGVPARLKGFDSGLKLDSTGRKP